MTQQQQQQQPQHQYYYSYYDDLAAQALQQGTAETFPESDIIQVTVVDDEEKKKKIRIGSITALLPESSKDGQVVFDVTMGISALIAMQDFNRRQSIFGIETNESLLALTRDCNFYLTMRFRDDAFSVVTASQEFIQEFMFDHDDDDRNNAVNDDHDNNGISITTSTSTTTTNSTNTTNNEGSSSRQQLSYLRSFATLGPILSPAATRVATLAAVTTRHDSPPQQTEGVRSTVVVHKKGNQGIITMSNAAGSDLLEDRTLYPYFARTNTPQSGMVEALMKYLYQELHVQHLAVLHVANDYGQPYLQAILKQALRYHENGDGTRMRIHVTSFRDDDAESIQQSIRWLQDHPELVYHVCIFTGGNFDVLLALYDAGLLGENSNKNNNSNNQRVWFFPGNVRDIAEQTAVLNKNNNSNPDNDDEEKKKKNEIYRLADLHKALNRSIAISAEPPHDLIQILQEHLETSFIHDTALQEYYLQRHVGKNGIFIRQPNEFYKALNNSELFPKVSNSRLNSYDAIMALGIAACQVEKDIFAVAAIEEKNDTTNKNSDDDDDADLHPYYDDYSPYYSTPALYEKLKTITFMGASGPVSFTETATRNASFEQYRLVNFLTYINETDDTSTVQEITSLIMSQSRGVEQVLQPIIFSNGETIPPAPLRPVSNYNEHLVSLEMRIFCWCIAGAVLICSATCAVWTWIRRNRVAVRASQPIFLILLSIGTFVLGCAIIPWTFQEPLSDQVLNKGCMLTMWLLFLGFSLAFASIFTKTWRITQILVNARAFRRTKITAKDVIWVPVAIVMLNIVILTVWTVVDPLEWNRIVTQVDFYDRPVESYGTCFHFNSATHQGKNNAGLISLFILVAFNILAFLVTAIQSYRSRFLPSQYNERFHLAFASFVMLEAVILGIPILFLVSGDDPTVLMVVGSWIFAIWAFAVLLPMFVPKLMAEEPWMNACCRAGVGHSAPAANSGGPTDTIHDDRSLRAGIVTLLARGRRGSSNRSWRRNRQNPSTSSTRRTGDHGNDGSSRYFFRRAAAPTNAAPTTDAARAATTATAMATGAACTTRKINNSNKIKRAET